MWCVGSTDTNIKMKYIKIAIGLLILLFSYLIPRNKKKWVFGSNMGYSNNAKYFFWYVVEILKKNDCIWIGSDRDVNIVRKLGYKAYRPWSAKGLYHSLTASAYIYDSYIGDINLYTFGGAKRVCLWHGVGIKYIEKKITSGPIHDIFNSQNIFVKVANLSLFIKPNLFLSTSPLMTKHFADCFDIPEKLCFEGVYPRCEIFKWDKELLMKYICKYEPSESLSLIRKMDSFKYTYLYMPTWRDNGRDFIKDSNIDLALLDEVLKKTNQFFILKFHPATKINIDFKDYSNIFLLDNKLDIYPILPFTNCLITDYSSVFYDYILLDGKKCILFIPDYKEYIEVDRGFAFDYIINTTGYKVTLFEELLHVIEDNTLLEGCMLNVDRIISRFWGTESKEINDFFRAI